MKIKAYAKINLALDVLKKSSDGYRFLQTILQQIDLHDVITLEKIREPKIVLTCNDQSLPLGPKNTIQKAIHEIKKTTRKLPTGLKIHLQKNIPVAAGLGGGSSDAAGVLKALNKLWQLKFTKKELHEIAARIGMDVPFFLEGGTAHATHYGEKIKPLPSMPRLQLLLIVPKQKKSTSKAYQLIEKHPKGRGLAKTQKLKRLIQDEKWVKKSARADFLTMKHLRTRQLLSPLLHNDFDALYQNKFAALKKKIMALKPLTIHHTGSGPAFYAIFQNAKDLQKAYQLLKPHGAKKIRTHGAKRNAISK